MKYRYLLILILLGILTSCNNKILFTYDIKKRLDEKDLDIERVQFYNSEKILLRRSIPFDEAMVSAGEIKFENGQYVEEIIIKKETPGACDYDGDMELGVSFEQGENKIIRFRLNKLGNFYEVDVQKKGGGIGKIEYDSTKYEIQPISESARLLIKKNDRYVYQVNQRIAKGVLVH